MQIFLQIIIPLVTTILTSIATGCMVHFKKQAKEYKKMLDDKENADLKQTIREEQEPLIEEIHRLQLRIEAIEEHHEDQIGIILASYKFRLIYLCKTYMRQGYITETQYEQLSEFFRIYHDLGGNGQAQEYYELVTHLPLHSSEEEE